MADFYEYSTPELVRLLGSRFKEYRMRCNLTQKEVAEQSVNALDDVLPELPESPYLVRREEKKAQRIRHTNKK